MNCPFCGGPMEKGHLDNGRRDLGLMWFPETRKIPIYEICTEASIEEKGGLLLNHPKLGKKESRIVTSWICRSCKKGVFEWET